MPGLRSRESGGEQPDHRRRNRLVSPRQDLDDAGGPRGARRARQACLPPNSWSLLPYGEQVAHALDYR
jgi:hypothetical protein